MIDKFDPTRYKRVEEEEANVIQKLRETGRSDRLKLAVIRKTEKIGYSA